MKTFIDFLNESPIRAMTIDKRLVYDKTLYLGMARVKPGGGIFYPVMKYKSMSSDPEIEVAHVTDTGTNKKIEYVGEYAEHKPSIVDHFLEVLPRIRKDIGKI